MPAKPEIYPVVLGDFRYRENPGRWRFVLEEDLRIRFPLDYWGEHRFHDQKGTLRVSTSGNVWTIHKGYAWDGCSPKIFLFGRHLGTPDFEATRAASAWHDSAGQFRHLECTKQQIPGGVWNRRFGDIIRGQGSDLVASAYVAGLTLGNPFYQLLGKLAGGSARGRCEMNHG